MLEMSYKCDSLCVHDIDLCLDTVSNSVSNVFAYMRAVVVCAFIILLP